MPTTHGGRKAKSFNWEFHNNYVIINNEKGRREEYSLNEMFAVLSWLSDRFGAGWFPLANNVEKLGRDEETDGLGVAILRQQPRNVRHAQGSSYLGVVLEDAGLLEWNNRQRRIEWRIIHQAQTVDELRAAIDVTLAQQHLACIALPMGGLQPMQKQKLTESLELIFKGIKKLKETFPNRSFTIDGRLVGDIGEVIAALEYDIVLHATSQPEHDGYTHDGRKVQIKATFKDSLTFKTVPEYFLGFKLFQDGKFEEIYNGPGNLIYEKYKHRKGIGKQLLSFPNFDLKELSSSVSETLRIPKKKSKVNNLLPALAGTDSEITPPNLPLR